MVSVTSVRGKRAVAHQQTVADENFVQNMNKLSFVRELLEGAGITTAPCHFCKWQVERACPKTVGDFECQDYVPYTRSSEKMEKKILSIITEKQMHLPLAA